MSALDWDRLTQLFHAASALPVDARVEFLAHECSGDSALRTAVDRLIAAHERSGRFMETPAIANVAHLFDQDVEPSAIGRRFGPYRVVREIARGGMGAVYLAERDDGEFQQRVAVKFIKRGMDTDALRQRFRAERQILASLDHPHIGRLLDGGRTDDGRPYFIMEYIEGQPIDEYADAKRLSVAERLRLFLQVCSALSYAHGKHVIHRDIKPANILVTKEGVPKLLDFGIAKAIDPDADNARLSVTGFPLLTPEYASPEQIAGKTPTVASDVYSLGVVLYELLTGRSPYRLRSRDPLDVADAVRTTDPERPSVVVTRPSHATDDARRHGVSTDRAAATNVDNAERLRRQLRGDLDTIVLMALRKEPERRYRTVDDFAQDIQRHLDGMPVRARPDSIRYRTSKFVRRRRAVLLVAAVAGAAVLVIAAALVAFRTSADRREPSLIATGAIAARDRILVADLADHAGDPQLAGALSEALRVDIAQSPVVQVLSTRQVRSALQRMERAPDLALDDTLAREIAVREGVKAFVTGRVSRVGAQYDITAQLVGAEKGELLAALRETAPDSSEVIRSIARLSGRLRQRIGESVRSVRETPSLEQVTTTSLGALRNYTAGVRAVAGGERMRGVEFLKAATAADTGFASAYRLLGVTYGDMVEPGRMTAALDHALANQARLPFYERYQTVASYSYAVLEDYPAAINAYERILSRYPNDVRALNNLGLVYQSARNYAMSESLLTQAKRVDSTIPTIQGGLVMAQLLRGHYDAARRSLDTLEARFPGVGNARLSEIYLAAAQQHWEEAERQARTRLATRRDDQLDPLDANETLAGILMTQGRLDEAERTSRRVMSIAPKLQSPGRYLSSAVRIAYIDLRYGHDSAKALALVDSALRRFPMDSIAEADRPVDQLAQFYASANRPARARQLVAEAERSSDARARRIKPLRRWTRGVIALAEGRARESIPDLRAASDSGECTICVLPDLAGAYEALAQPDSAIAIYERYRSTPWKWRFEPDAIELGWTLKRLGELYEARREPRKAADAYAQLVQLWQRADARLQPVVADVRSRLVKMGATKDVPVPR